MKDMDNDGEIYIIENGCYGEIDLYSISLIEKGVVSD